MQRAPLVYREPMPEVIIFWRASATDFEQYSLIQALEKVWADKLMQAFLIPTASTLIWGRRLQFTIQWPSWACIFGRWYTESFEG